MVQVPLLPTTVNPPSQPLPSLVHYLGGVYAVEVQGAEVVEDAGGQLRELGQALPL